MKTKAFTLIELLVVISIIGVLATMVLSSISDARSRARDAQRHRDIRTIQTQLELYYLKQGRYPFSANIGGVAPSDHLANSGNASWVTLETDMGVTLPRDPVNFTPVTAQDWSGGTSKRFNYTYYSGNYLGCVTGKWYMINYRLEKGDVTGSEQKGVIRCDTGATHIEGEARGGITVGITPRM